MSDGQARDWTSSLVSEATFDDLTLLAARLSGTAMALISVRRRGDEWVRAVVGISDADLPRLQPFLDAVMAASEMVIIRDTLADPRFAASAAVVNGPNVRFFAGAPVMGPGGPIYGALGVFDVQPRDLSVDQTRALFVIARHVSAYFEQRREEVRESEQRFRVMADAAPALIWVAGVDGRVAYFNRRWVEYLGGAAGSDPEETWRLRVHPEDREAAVKAFRPFPMSREHVSREYRLLRADGEYGWIYEVAARRFLPDGTPIGFVGSGIDITEQKRTALRLQETSERLHTLIEALPDGVFFKDGQGRWLIVNSAAKNLFHLEGVAWEGKTDRDLAALQPELREAYEACVQTDEAAWQLGRPSTAVETMTGHDGVVHAFEATKVPLFNEQGGRHGLVIIGRDVTEKLRADQAVRDSEAKLAAVVDSAMDAIIGVDGSQTIVLFNAAAEDMFGCPAADVIGQPLDRFLPQAARAPHRDHIRAFAASSDARRRRNVLGDLRALRANGEEFPFDGSISCITVGNRELFTIIMRDITERKRAEANVQAYVYHLKCLDLVSSALARSPDLPSMITNLVTTTKSIFGVDRVILLHPCGADVMVASVRADCHDGYCESGSSQAEAGELILGEPARRLMAAAIDSDAVLVNEAGSIPACMRSAHTCSALSQLSVAVKPREGKPWMLILQHCQRERQWTIHEQTLLREVALRFSDALTAMILHESMGRTRVLAAMGALVGGVAHEVRNPLFAISSTIDAFEAEFGDRAELAEFITPLRDQTQRLAALMRDLLDYGRPTTRTFAPVRLGDVVAQAVRTSRPSAVERGVEVKESCATDLPTLTGDAQRLLQLLTNLLENAIQHSSAGGIVSIEAAVSSRVGTAIECSIVDSGSGFRAEDLPHVFDPFFTRRRGGTGLGLSIAQRIAEEHGGVLVAKNRPEGGALMMLTLPIGRA